MIVENLFGHIKQLEHCWIGARVVNVVALFAANHKIFRTQDSQLLRDVRQFYFQAVANLRNSQFLSAQLVENSDSQRISQSLEELSLEVDKFFSHALDYLLCAKNFLNTNLIKHRGTEAGSLER